MLLKAATVTLSVFFIIGGLSTITAAQSSSPKAKMPGSMATFNTIGNHRYVAPNTVFVPDSSVERAADVGQFAHTDYVLFSPYGRQPTAMTNLSLTMAETQLPWVACIRLGQSIRGVIR